MVTTYGRVATEYRRGRHAVLNSEQYSHYLSSERKEAYAEPCGYG